MSFTEWKNLIDEFKESGKSQSHVEKEVKK